MWGIVKRGHLHAANLGMMAPVSNWTAAISRTTDAGKTWQTVLEINGQFYFNGIECSSDQDCCVVAEDQGNTVAADDGTCASLAASMDSPCERRTHLTAPPPPPASPREIDIYCTTDGGNTWADNYRNTNGASSLTDIAAVSPQEYWAIGGQLGEISPLYPTFFHSTDSGATWTAGTGTADMLTTYGIAIDCVQATANSKANCWVNVLDVLTQESSLLILDNSTLTQ